MPVRTGQEYITGLKERPREVWIDGQRVQDVTTHPALRNGVKSVAALYDMQNDPELREEMTYASPTTGHPVGLSFLVPQTIQDLERRRHMMARWAWASCGMMGRSPDFLNVIFAAWSGAADYFAQNRSEFKNNVVEYYDFIRENDVTLTHALLNLQRRRAPVAVDTVSDAVALTVVHETDAGIIVRGSRLLATLGPIADELAIYHAGNHRLGEDARRQSFAFAIPCDTLGLKFLCRESFDLGRSHFNHPLGSRFEEMDCVVFFDDVLVPWERVFLLGDVDLVNGAALKTHASRHSAHQGAAKNLAKCELVLGVALLMTQTLGNAHLPHSEERLGELMMYTELMRACLRAAEADAEIDEWGVMCPSQMPAEITRNLFMTAYPRMVEILQLLGSSSFMIIPSEADFASPLAPDIEQYLATDNSTARDRVKLFRLAWDIACSSFGSRQVLYERFFASDPLTRARVLNAIYPKQEVMERVLEFLGRSDDKS